jgi:hypothetical protein
MSHRTLIALAASAIIGIGCIAMMPTDAFARGGRGGGGVHHGGVHHAGVGHVGVGRVGVRPGVAVGVGAAAVGAAAARGAYCGYAPYPPCY